MTDMISGAALQHFVPLVRRLGGDPDHLLRAQGIPLSAAGDTHHLISYPDVVAVIGRAAIELNRPDFGMILAAEQGIDFLGPVAVLIRNSETVLDAIEGVCRYLYHCAPPEIATLERGPTTSAFIYTIASRQIAHRDQIIEKSLAVALNAFRLMIGEDFVPWRITMRHGPISSLGRYREFFGCSVEFGSRVNALYFPSYLLDHQVNGRNSAALMLAENYLAQNGNNLPLIEYVRETIHRLMKLEQAALVPVADAMSMHPRVLQRRLAEVGMSFEDILDDVRRSKAWQLSTSNLQVSQIATLLGYSEQSSYARACKRWYGETPKQLIARRRASLTGPNDMGPDRMAMATTIGT
ncbi:AraC family transcriptional regulator [Sphingobium sp. CR2-8]|uniref:AraC family transcriptional regulator n=1 Tax=Sphingobium sp. CR2-8 TaxID=1306534 RepID=UPI002DB6C314|nr:AraC family transcriptional regulator [Sphingobium sp. CR2-8]MEC3909384.1 AraC family transcriptional regulator [Sphingobium sp. CR2-8]